MTPLINWRLQEKIMLHSYFILWVQRPLVSVIGLQTTPVERDEEIFSSLINFSLCIYKYSSACYCGFIIIMTYHEPEFSKLKRISVGSPRPPLFLFMSTKKKRKERWLPSSASSIHLSKIPYMHTSLELH